MVTHLEHLRRLEELFGQNRTFKGIMVDRILGNSQELGSASELTLGIKTRTFSEHHRPTLNVRE